MLHVSKCWFLSYKYFLKILPPWKDQLYHKVNGKARRRCPPPFILCYDDPFLQNIFMTLFNMFIHREKTIQTKSQTGGRGTPGHPGSEVFLASSPTSFVKNSGSSKSLVGKVSILHLLLRARKAGRMVMSCSPLSYYACPLK